MESLGELLKEKEINKILRKYLKVERNCTNYNKVNFESYAVELLAEGVGYLGQHYLLIIKFDKTDEISFFVKIPRENQTDYFEEIFVFNKETNLYRNVLSKLKAESVIPRYYKTESENVIVLENLSNLNYKLFANQEAILNMEHLMIALKSLATLHAASVNHERESGKSLVESFPEFLQENSFIDTPIGLRKYRLENAIKVFQICIPEIDELKNCKNVKEIVDTWPDLMRQIYEFVKPSKQFRNVFLHGDLWCNNLLFKYNDKDSIKPISCKFVDFQFSRYAPAALDVTTLIVLTTFQEFRDKYWKNLLNFYYANFVSQVNNKHIPIESFDTFFDSCQHYNLAALIEKSIFTHYPPEMSDHLISHLKIDYSNYNYITNFPFEVAKIAFHNDLVYRRRLKDVALEVISKYMKFE